jgi:NAD(P)-dependent dehydrogenase (short-subunit alcohol dehydrogenase family)
MDHASWRKVLAINLDGVFNCTKVFIDGMLKQSYHLGNRPDRQLRAGELRGVEGGGGGVHQVARQGARG